MYASKPLSFLIAIVSLCFITTQSYAQCSSNVLFSENFGGDNNSPLTSSRLPAGVTTYAFDSLGAIDDGQYGIRKTTADIATGQRQFST